MEVNTEDPEVPRRRKSGWDIVFGFGGILAVMATLIVALVNYKQSVHIQDLQAKAGEDVQKIKAQSDLAIQQQAGKSSLTLAELDNSLKEKLGGQDNAMKKYVNDENVRLGRFAKESDVDLKLVEVATDILKAPQPNDALRGWAVQILSIHSKVKINEAATKEAKAGPIVGEPVEVSVASSYSDGTPTTGCSVKYSRPGDVTSFRFPELTRGGVTKTMMSKGAYNFWVECAAAPSEHQQFYVQSPIFIEFKVPAKHP